MRCDGVKMQNVGNINVGRSAFHSKTQIWGHRPKTRFFQLFWYCGLLRIRQDRSLDIFYLKQRQDKTTPAAEQNNPDLAISKSTVWNVSTDFLTPFDFMNSHVRSTFWSDTLRKSDLNWLSESGDNDPKRNFLSNYLVSVHRHRWFWMSMKWHYFVRRRGSLFPAIFEGKKC